MVTELVIGCRIEGGRLKIRNLRKFESELSRMRDGEGVLRIEPAKATRSLNANAWYWGVIVHELSEHTGYTPDEMHEFLKAKFIPKRLSVQNGNGVIVDELVIGGTTREMSKSDFSEYCESIRRWAAEDLGLNIPDPS